MSFFVSDAFAQAAPPAGGGGSIWELLPLVLVFLILYLFFVRPQMKKQREHKHMVEALVKGDEVVTNGGLLGRVLEIGENFVVLEVAKETKVKIQRQSVSATMPKGTYEKTL
ncbi:MAG: preprotein translocase subunit YajC [Gammaproteobacteria bacterium]